MSTPAPEARAGNAAPPRPRGLVPSEHAPPRRRPPSRDPYRVKMDPAATTLPRRPWRAVKTGLGITLLVALGVFAAVQGIRTLAEVVETDDESPSLTSYENGDSGVDVSDVEQGFSVVFPRQPTRSLAAVPGTGGSDVASTLVAEVDGAEFATTWYELGGEVEDPAAVLSLIAAVTADDLGGELEDEGMLPTAPLAAHEFGVVRDDGTDLVRHVLDDRTVYQLRVSADAPLGSAFRRFVESFETVEDGP